MSLIPLISVIIPSKNRGDLLLRAVNSIAEQSYENIEIIIVDDGSFPAISLEKVKLSSGDVSVKLIRNEISKGGAKARNLGVSACKGEYVCFLDDDDIYLPNKILILYQALLDNPLYSIVFGKTILNNGAEKRYPINYPKKFDPELNYLLGNYIHTSATLIKRNIFEHVSFHEILPKYQDTQFHLELTEKYRILFIDKTVSEWFVDDREDQITSIKTHDKVVKSYEAFLILKIYFEDNLKVKPLRLAFFEYYSSILRIRAKQKYRFLSLFKILGTPTKCFYIIKVYLNRKKYFKPG